MFRFTRMVVVMLCLVACAAGCSRIGPHGLSVGRGHYNAAIQGTNSEQLLMNLVRLRYREAPFFLEVASVSQAFDAQVGSSTAGTFPRRSPNTWVLGLSGSIADKPTVTYTPLQGERFVRELLTPIEFEKIALLVNSGWSVSRTFRLTLQELNGLKNAPSASGPTPLHEPTYAEFRRAVDLLRALEVDGQLQIAYFETEQGARLALTFTDAARASDNGRELYRLLSLDVSRSTFYLGPEAGPEHITVIPRPLVASLFYLSQAVSVPAGHAEKGYVTVTRRGDGSEFDWQEVTGNLMQVRVVSSRRAMQEPAVAVPYRGQWYYIADDDLESKSTFLLLQQMFALQSGETKAMAPVLTLPVAQ